MTVEQLIAALKELPGHLRVTLGPDMPSDASEWLADKTATSAYVVNKDSTEDPRVLIHWSAQQEGICGHCPPVSPDVPTPTLWGVYDMRQHRWWPRSFQTQEDAQAHYDRCKGPGSRCEIRLRPTKGNS